MSTIVLSQQNFFDTSAVPIPAAGEFTIGFHIDGTPKIKYDNGSVVSLIGSNGPAGATGPVGSSGLSVGGGNSLIWQAGSETVSGQFSYPNGNWGIINGTYDININRFEFFASSDVANWFVALRTGVNFAGLGKAILSIYQTDDNTNFAIFTINTVTDNTNHWTINGRLLVYGGQPSITSGSSYNISWLLFGKDGDAGPTGSTGNSGTSGSSGSSGTSGVTYKSYVALLTQTGTSNPVATVLENTLGATPSVTRISSGIYIINSVGAFPANKTVIDTSTKMSIVSGSMFNYQYYRSDDNTVEINTFNGDNTLLNAEISIRVYN